MEPVLHPRPFRHDGAARRPGPLARLPRAAVMPLGAALMLGLGVAAWNAFGTRSAAADPTSTAPAASSPAPPAAAPSIDVGPAINLRRTVTVQVVQKTKDAVVNISARKMFPRRVQLNNGLFPLPFDTGQVVQVPGNSLGSGFIIHRDGYVVTNNHVIDHARQITVDLADGRSLSADLVSADPDADLAVLRIHSPAPLPTLDLGESSDLMIGEPVIAVGNPLGFSHSVSTGIVSALHRDIDPRHGEQPGQPQPPAKGEDAALRDLVQTDAAINPGNSGGPLLNAYGQVIGINTAIRGDAQNIGFAIPIDRLRDLIPELMNPAQVTRVDVPVKLAERRSIAEPATVTATVVAAPNAAGGGTPLAAIDGVRPTNIVDAYAQLLTLKAGQPVTFTWANGQAQRVTTQPAPMPDAVVQARQRFGLHVEPVTPMLADKYHLATEDGLFVTAVDRDSNADRAHIQPGDVIVQFSRVRLASLDDFGALVPRLPDTGQARVWVVRGQEMGFVVMKF